MKIQVIIWDNDPSNREVLDRDEWCYGARTGATSEMCGGCQGCLLLQAEHSGFPYAIIEEETDVSPKQLHANNHRPS